MFTIKYTLTPAFTGAGSPNRKLADVELHFTEAAGLLAGLKLIGFGVQQLGDLGRYVSFPGCTLCLDGVEHLVSLLRPIDHASVIGPLRDRILEEYATYEALTAEAR